MEKLKYIKIEHEDGTLSENVPIGADASNIDVSASKTLNTKLSELDASDTQNTNAISTLQSSISGLQSQVSSLASGSPAGVYATVAALTSADPDHSKIYIVAADGHWYYYSNNTWTDGGVYQAAEDSETIQLLEDYDNGKVYITGTSFANGIFKKDGSIQTTSSGIYEENYISFNTSYIGYEVADGYQATIYFFSGTPQDPIYSRNYTGSFRGNGIIEKVPKDATMFRYFLRRNDLSSGMALSEADNVKIYFPANWDEKISILDEEITQINSHKDYQIPYLKFGDISAETGAADGVSDKYLITIDPIELKGKYIGYEIDESSGNSYDLKLFFYSGTADNPIYIDCSSITRETEGFINFPTGTTLLRYKIRKNRGNDSILWSERRVAKIYFANENKQQWDEIDAIKDEIAEMEKIEGITFENAGLNFMTGEELSDTDNKIRRSSYIAVGDAKNIRFTTTDIYQLNFFFYKKQDSTYDFIDSYIGFSGIDEEMEIPLDTTHFRYTIRKSGSTSIDTSATKIYLRYRGTSALNTLPQYYKKEIQTVKNLIYENSELDSIIFAVMGDSHYVTNFESQPGVNRQLRTMKQLANDYILDFTCQIGDLLTGSSSESLTQDYVLKCDKDIVEKIQKYMSQQRVPFIQSKGDHDSNRHYNSNQDYEFTLSEWNKRIYPFVTRYNGIQRIAGSYSESFIFDIPDKKTRIVNIDTGTQTSINSVGLKEKISLSSMYSWLTDTAFANDYKDGWQYIILTHVPCDHDAHPDITARFQNIMTMCSAVNDQANWSYDNTISGSTETALSASKDFSNWTSKVRIISSGHYHCSRFAKNNSNIVISYTPCPNRGAKAIATYEDLASRCSGLNWNTNEVRTPGTIEEAAFDIFIVNSNNVKRVRFGNLGATVSSGYGNGLISKVTTINTD